MSSESDIRATAARLSIAAGRPPPLAFAPISGGKNNRVYRLDYGDGVAPAALKRYFVSKADPRNRLATEWAFLTYARARGVDAVPSALAVEEETHSALYSFVPGRKLAPGEVGAREVGAALDFIAAINSAPRAFAEMPAGSEACFAVGQHLALIDRRVTRLEQQIGPDVPMRDEAMHFVRTMIFPAWETVRARILRAAATGRINSDTALAPSEICLSPSDFGFHNALVRPDGKITFIDFEYAGRDDPAKLVCDFFCQPEVPVPLDLWRPFTEGVIARLDLSARFRVVFDLLLDAYRLKWVCIILNEFVATDAARRGYAVGSDRITRCSAQLAKAQEKLAQVAL